ncbi:MAG: SMR family transporter [Pseudomonadota bacterium]
MKYFYLLLSIGFNVASYTLYKGISNRQSNAIWYLLLLSGLALGGINVLFFTKALKGIQLNVAYPVFSGACILSIALISSIIFGERMSAANIAGAVVVVIGITLLSI